MHNNTSDTLEPMRFLIYFAFIRRKENERVKNTIAFNSKYEFIPSKQSFAWCSFKVSENEQINKQYFAFSLLILLSDNPIRCRKEKTIKKNYRLQF